MEVSMNTLRRPGIKWVARPGVSALWLEAEVRLWYASAIADVSEESQVPAETARGA